MDYGGRTPDRAYSKNSWNGNVEDVPIKPVASMADSLPLLNGKEFKKDLTEKQPLESKAEVSGSKPHFPSRPKRKAVQRTREEEMVAYGRIFEGCGLQSDYDVLTKLGEGTFGCVLICSHGLQPAPLTLTKLCIEYHHLLIS